MGNALERVRNHLYQGQLGTLLRPLDHSRQIQPWVATLATQTHDEYEPPHNATQETVEEIKQQEKGAAPEQALDAHLRKFLSLTPGGHPTSPDTYIETTLGKTPVCLSWIFRLVQV